MWTTLRKVRSKEVKEDTPPDGTVRVLTCSFQAASASHPEASEGVLWWLTLQESAGLYQGTQRRGLQGTSTLYIGVYNILYIDVYTLYIGVYTLYIGVYTLYIGVYTLYIGVYIHVWQSHVVPKLFVKLQSTSSGISKLP